MTLEAVSWVSTSHVSVPSGVTCSSPYPAAAMTSVVAGPAAEIAKLRPALCGARPRSVTPPSSDRAMDRTGSPYARPTAAWASSCSRIDR